MELLDIVKQFLTAFHQVVGLLCVFLAAFRLGKIQHGLQLVKQVTLRHFVGVHLQTEGCHSYFLHSCLHHLQGSHLLSNEQYALAVIEGIGYDIRDGLTLAGSRRAVEDEASFLP